MIVSFGLWEEKVFEKVCMAGFGVCHMGVDMGKEVMCSGQMKGA